MVPTNTGIFLRGLNLYGETELSKYFWYPKRKLGETMHFQREYTSVLVGTALNQRQQGIQSEIDINCVYQAAELRILIPASRAEPTRTPPPPFPPLQGELGECAIN